MSGTFGAAPRELKIFISSPSDVETERNVAVRVIALLDDLWREHVSLSYYNYRDESFTSQEGFQEQVPDVAQYDLVIGILWKRIGTQLNPAKFSPELRRHESGTVYELETAFEAWECAPKHNKRPDVVVFHKKDKVQYDADAVEEQKGQREKLVRWMESCFGGPGQPVKRAAIPIPNSPDAFENQLQRWIEDWLRKKQLIPSGPSWNIARDGSPYPGLVAYDARHSRVFKGRDTSIRRALALLRRRAARGEGSLFVVGPSGSGKSSFARAGLGQRLLAAAGIEGVGVWRQVLVEPSDDPLAMLARRLFTDIDALPELAKGAQSTAESWAKLARQSPESAAEGVAWALGKVAEGKAGTAGSSRPLPARLLVIADQLETVTATMFILARSEPRRGFVVGNDGDPAWHVLLVDSNEFAVANENGIVSVWRLPNLSSEDLAWQPQLKQLAVLQGHQGAVVHLAWHASAKLLASASKDGTVRLWRRQQDYFSSPKWEPFTVLRRHDAKVVSVAFTPDGSRLGSLARNSNARLWDTKPAQEGPSFTASYYNFLDPTSKGVDLLAFSGDSSRLLTLVRGKVVRLWDSCSGRQIALLGAIDYNGGFSTRESPATSHAAFSADSTRIVTAHSDGTAAIWDWTSSTKLHSLAGHGVALSYVQFDGDAQRIITTGADRTVRLWNARTGKCMKTLGPLDSAPSATVLNQEGTLLAATHEDKSVSLWNIRSRRLIARLGGPDQPALDPVFDSCGKTLRTVGKNDGSMRVWDLATGALKGQENLDVERSSVYSAWTLQGRFFVATDSDGETRVWDRTRPGEPVLLRGHTKAVTVVAIAPNGAELITGSQDEGARLWDLPSGRQLALYPGHSSGVSWVTFSADGKLIATVANDGTARIWYARANELREEARRRMPQRLSPQIGVA